MSRTAPTRTGPLRATLVTTVLAALFTAGASAGASAAPGAQATTSSPDSLVSAAGHVVTPQQAAESVTGTGPTGRSGFAGTAKQPATAGTDSIIGVDQRFRVSPTTSYPARAVALVSRNGNPSCTAWLVSKDTVLTAGHCVHSGGPNGVWYSNLTFRAGSDGGTAPYGTCSSRQTYALNGWLNGTTSSYRRQYDAAIVKLNCTVGYRVGWFGMWWQTASLDGLSTAISGYPGDKPSEQWRSYDHVRASETQNIYYRNDTVGGMSGSPVYQRRAAGAASCSGVCAMAIHTNGLFGSGLTASNNSGTRITQARFNTFVSIINQP
ncbi:extracellular metalloprotease Mpr [Kineococcus sp. NUM-3379]